MNNIHDIETRIKKSSYMMHMLKTIQIVSPRLYLAGGMLRRFVWDELHGHVFSPFECDADVIYFDTRDDRSVEIDFEDKLRLITPGIMWEVRNSSRMHRSNGDKPYSSLEDALAHYPETATSIAARMLANESLEFIMAHGCHDLVNGIIRPVPDISDQQLQVFHRRHREKGWLKQWPGLTLVEPSR